MTESPPAIVIVNKYRISCDGGGGALGHPKVWLQIPSEQGWIECPYCDTKMVHQDFEDKV